MRATSTLTLLPQAIATTPRYLGVNLEFQDYTDQLNLWDWLADSGITAVRELHPARFLRPDGYADSRWETITTRELFDQWRAEIRTAPEKYIDRSSVQLDACLPWLGTPAAFLGKVADLGIEPVISIDYNPRTFSQPLLNDLEAIGSANAELNWPAVASAYAYSYALALFTARDHGARIYSMMNEPENRFGWFHLPEDLHERLGVDPWGTVSEGADRSLSERYFRIVARQYAVLARFTRLALDDVEAALRTGPLRLLGPTNVVWKPFWGQACSWLDSCDVHHYSPDPQSFEKVYAGVRAVAEASGKSFSVTEFNRFSGPVPIADSLLNPIASLDLGEVLMQVLSLGDVRTPCELAALYLFNAPSTHRNHKHLLYGSLDFVDWSGRDAAPWNRSPAWYPSIEEMQIRHPTLAYLILRMLGRACRPHRWSAETEGPYPIHKTSLHNPTSADPKGVATHLQSLVVKHPKALFIHILNKSERPVHSLRIDDLTTNAKTVIVRSVWVESLEERVVAEAVVDGGVSFDMGPRSFVQVIVPEMDLGAITGFNVEEITDTPGSLADLKLWQTTRLRTFAETPGGVVDVTDLCAVFSSRDDCFRVTASGLVQRIRESTSSARIAIRLAGSPQTGTDNAIIFPCAGDS